jgi:diaminopimelate decarboxylase
VSILKDAKNRFKPMLISAAGALPPAWLQRVVQRAPRRLLRNLNHPSLRSKFSSGQPIPKSFWGISRNPDNHMVVQGCDCVALAQQYQTPLFVVDGDRLASNFRQFASSFNAHYPLVEVGYSYKTNPLPGALQELHQLGALAEVVSPYELKLALELGVPGDKIVYNGPGKSMQGLELAVANRIGMINVDGFSEIEKVGNYVCLICYNRTDSELECNTHANISCMVQLDVLIEFVL